MNKVIFCLALFIVLLNTAAAVNKCTNEVKIDDAWTIMDEKCISSMGNQINEELKASMKYLSLAAHFSQASINRPGFAKFFFNSASEEREHAIKLIEYLQMRGRSNLTQPIINTKEIFEVFNENTPPRGVSGLDALKSALKLETTVTQKIRNVISDCEQANFNDYHLVDYLTGVYLEEQYKGQRDIAGMIVTLEKMTRNINGENGIALGEYLYDKKLLA